MNHFKTLRDVPCWMGHEWRKYDRYYLLGGLEFKTTNPRFNEEGNFVFELHDEEGFIGLYSIHKTNLDLIEEL